MVGGDDEMSDNEVVVVEDDESAGSKKTADDPPMPVVDTAWLSYLAQCTAPSLLSRAPISRKCTAKAADDNGCEQLGRFLAA